MTTPTKIDNWDDESNEVQSNWVKFYVPLEDKILGTLIAKRTMKSTIPGKEAEDVNVYELKADLGSFHVKDDDDKIVAEPVKINAGEIWSIGGKNSIDIQMRNIKVGQKVGFKFIDEKPSKTKGFAPAKNIKVYALKNDDGTPKMDKEWLQEQEAENFPDSK
jgi:hypothetical protein|tara:strand:+ start:2802 stop:3287 length:486 start_codon:yes stop_codon:yes gene_type:complete